MNQNQQYLAGSVLPATGGEDTVSVQPEHVDLGGFAAERQNNRCPGHDEVSGVSCRDKKVPFILSSGTDEKLPLV